MNETGTEPHLITDFAPIPKQPKATLIDWLKYYLWNLYRKPLVWKKQKELLSIYQLVKRDIESKILPQLWDRRFICNQCHDAYQTLKPQVFLSQIEMILRFLSKDHEHIHWRTFDSFHNFHKYDFERSEKISAWINGFGD